MIATGIPEVHLPSAWPAIWPLIEPALAFTGERIDILRGLYGRDLQCWAVYDKNTALAGIVTRLRRDRTSGELRCQIWLVGGSRLLEWAADFLRILNDWAKAEGCAVLEAAGRPGWKRIAPKLGFAVAYQEGPDTYWHRAVI